VATLGRVLGSPLGALGFVGSAGGFGFLYSLLLPFDYTQRFELANWHYLSARLVAWSVVLGLGMGLVMSIELYALRRAARARAGVGATGGLAFLASLAPSFLCCTPVVPTVLAFVGVSGVGLYGTTGALQHFFASHQNAFLGSSVALLALSVWWALTKLSTAPCLSESGCDLERPSPGVARAGQADQGALR